MSTVNSSELTAKRLINRCNISKFWRQIKQLIVEAEWESWMGRGFNIITHRGRSSTPQGNMVSLPLNHQVARIVHICIRDPNLRHMTESLGGLMIPLRLRRGDNLEVITARLAVCWFGTIWWTIGLCLVPLYSEEGTSGLLAILHGKIQQAQVKYPEKQWIIPFPDGKGKIHRKSFGNSGSPDAFRNRPTLAKCGTLLEYFDRISINTLGNCIL